jgi:ribosomal protein L32
MGLPVKKTPKSKTKRRRSHLHLKKVAIRIDEDGMPHLPHHANPSTGKYRNRAAVNTQKRASRRARKLKKR